jgi:hypothetical protein
MIFPEQKPIPSAEKWRLGYCETNLILGGGNEEKIYWL